MGFKMKFVKAFSQVEFHRLRAVVLVGFFLLFFTFFALPKFTIFNFTALSSGLSMHSSSIAMIVRDKISSQQPDAGKQNVVHEMKPVCDFSDRRSDVCEIIGDIRVHGNSSSIIFNTSSQTSTLQRNESWRIKPHPRKGDKVVLSHITEIFMKSLINYKEAPPCTVIHNITAIIFSTGGYMGNMFHDFTDVLIPLFVTSRQFDRQVQFLVTDMNAKWIAKYKSFFRALSNYNVIDFNKDNRVHCFPHAIIGLRSHKEMSIDPSRAPNRYSMLDFARLIRSSFSLERETAIRLAPNAYKRPRILIIARRWTRLFKNVAQISRLAEKLGYETVVLEAEGSELSKFAHIVNSCDVLMGVHGAGLTNLVFLPTNAVVIQVVPLGRLDMIAWDDFGGPALDMKLNYLQYGISVEESTLVDQYPRDHPVLRDPVSIHQRGWIALRGMYLDKQNVRLDLERFRFILLQALHLLQE